MNAELSRRWSPDSDLDLRARRLAALGDPIRLAIVEALLVSDRSPSELPAKLTLPTNLLAHHLDALELAGLIERTPSEGDGRRRYIRVVWELLGDLIRTPHFDPTRVLFICHHNAARSQYAAAYWRRGKGTEALSAGSQPAQHVHPLAVAVAARRGLDLSSMRPRGYEEVNLVPTTVISVCDVAMESDAPFSPAHWLHWSVPDPAASDDPAAFESAFDSIEERIDRLSLQSR